MQLGFKLTLATIAICAAAAIERSIGWLQNFRRLVTRYEYYAHLFHGFVQLACLIVVMRRF